MLAFGKEERSLPDVELADKLVFFIFLGSYFCYCGSYNNKLFAYKKCERAYNIGKILHT